MEPKPGLHTSEFVSHLASAVLAALVALAVVWRADPGHLSEALAAAVPAVAAIAGIMAGSIHYGAGRARLKQAAAREPVDAGPAPPDVLPLKPA